jgi:RNA polymerase sigma factor (sigma-70 family)
MGESADDDLVARLVGEHERAYRAAWLILRDSHQAEEAVQEAFLRVWRFRGSLPAGDAIRPWMYRVVVNTSISALRHDRPRRASEVAMPAGDLGPTAAGGQDPGTAAEDADRASTMAEALGDLPEHLRVPVILHYWIGLSEKEIATAIGRRPGTVKSRLHDARSRLAADPRVNAARLAAGGEG